MVTVISVLGFIIIICLVLITSSLTSIANTLWDISQEIKKKQIW